MIGSLNTKALVTCTSWSRKGKQLSVGDSEGRIHQLIPELAIIRSSESPAASARCTTLCWLSTTEWLVAHQLMDGSVVVNLLILKKDHPPAWVSYRDLNLNSIGGGQSLSVGVLPILDWKMASRLNDEFKSDN